MSEHGDLEQRIDSAVRHRAQAMKWRPYYEDWVNRRIWQENYREAIISNLRRFVPALKKATVLDLGSGMGGTLVRLQKEGIKAVGVEYNLPHCRISRMRAQRYRFDTSVLNGCGEQLPLRDQSVDVILAHEVIEHVFDPKAVLAEMTRVLKPGGRIFLDVPNRWTLYDHHYHLWGISFLPRRIADRVVTWVGRSKADLSAGLQKLSEMHYYSWRGFVKLAHEVGFEINDAREEKLLSLKDQSLGSRARLWTIAVLRWFKLLKYAYRIYRGTFMSGFHVMLRCRDEQ